MTKYEPLARHLKSLKAASVRLSFKDIEKILGFKLPASADKYSAWWSNHGGSHVQTQAWLGAGWETSEVDLASGKVTFRRTGGASRPDNEAKPVKEVWGCMKGTVWVEPGYDLTTPLWPEEFS
jgi:hypothetical protein